MYTITFPFVVESRVEPAFVANALSMFDRLRSLVLSAHVGESM